jgi:hypothetical protein
MTDVHIKTGDEPLDAETADAVTALMLAAYKRELRRQQPTCPHDRLNEDGICRACGADCRGIGPA